MKKIVKLFDLRVFLAATIFIIMPLISQSEISGNQFFQEPLTIWQKKNWQNMGACNSGIEFLRDAQGKKFVLKYHPHYRYALNEVLGGLIASSINNNIVNQVIIAPSDYKKENQYATLHSHAWGKEVGTTEKRLVDIRDGLLCRDNLRNITIHSDLAKIVAINLFLNDWDCHNSNLFFSRKHNTFCAIDKGLIFYYQSYLARYAYDFLQSLKNNNINWGEIKSLAIIKKTLHTLIEQYPPQKIYTEWLDLAEKNNIVLIPEEKEIFLRHLNENYEEVKKVYEELEYITQNKFFIKALLITTKDTTIDTIATVGNATKRYAQLIRVRGIEVVNSVKNGIALI